MEITGLGGLILLIANVWAIIRTVQSNASTGKKTLWVVLIILLPLLGLIAWFFFGPRDAAS